MSLQVGIAGLVGCLCWRTFWVGFFRTVMSKDLQNYNFIHLCLYTYAYSTYPTLHTGPFSIFHKAITYLLFQSESLWPVMYSLTSILLEQQTCNDNMLIKSRSELYNLIYSSRLDIEFIKYVLGPKLEILMPFFALT